MHGITYPLLSVLLVYPLLVKQLGSLILEFFWNVMVVNLKGSSHCVTHSYLYLSFWANERTNERMVVLIAAYSAVNFIYEFDGEKLWNWSTFAEVIEKIHIPGVVTVWCHESTRFVHVDPSHQTYRPAQHHLSAFQSSQSRVHSHRQAPAAEAGSWAGCMSPANDSNTFSLVVLVHTIFHSELS